MDAKITKYPRLYIDKPFAGQEIIEFEGPQVHYLRNVMRKNRGEGLRVFNGKDGEYVVEISELGKKSDIA